MHYLHYPVVRKEHTSNYDSSEWPLQEVVEYYVYYPPFMAVQ